MDGVLNRLKNFDAYPKTLEDFRTKTYGGAISKMLISLQSTNIVAELFFWFTDALYLDFSYSC